MKKEFFIKFSALSAVFTTAVIAIMTLFSYIDIAQQFDKIIIALLIISLMGGFFGTFISEYSTE